jgi:DnaJ-class molecular chaperone
MKWRKRKSQLSDEIARLAGLEPHELLGVSEEATAEQIKRAYRILVKVYHPDRADPFMKKHNEKVIQPINDAYARLSAKPETPK